MAEQQFTPDFLAYNNFGIKPVEVTFQLDLKTLKNIISQIVMEKISGVEDVTIQFDEKGFVGIFAWFNSNSDHFNDRTTENTAINTKLHRYSKEFKAFAEKFGWNEADEKPESGNTKVHINRIVVGSQNREIKDKVAVHLALNPFIIIIFDMFGEVYKKEYSQPIPKAKLVREWIWSKGQSGKYNSLNGLRITKKVNNPALSRTELRARWGGKF